MLRIVLNPLVLSILLMGAVIQSTNTDTFKSIAYSLTHIELACTSAVIEHNRQLMEYSK